MKIYEKIVIDISTGQIIEEQSFQYDGPIAECKGGDSATTTYTYPRELEQIYSALMPGVNRLGALSQTGGWGSGAGQWGAVPGLQYLKGMKQQNLGGVEGGQRVLNALSGMTSREKAEYLGNLGGKGGGVEGGKQILRHLKTLSPGDRLGFLGDLSSGAISGSGGNSVQSRLSPYYNTNASNISNLVNRSSAGSGAVNIDKNLIEKNLGGWSIGALMQQIGQPAGRSVLPGMGSYGQTETGMNNYGTAPLGTQEAGVLWPVTPPPQIADWQAPDVPLPNAEMYKTVAPEVIRGLWAGYPEAAKQLTQTLGGMGAAGSLRGGPSGIMGASQAELAKDWGKGVEAQAMNMIMPQLMQQWQMEAGAGQQGWAQNQANQMERWRHLQSQQRLPYEILPGLAGGSLSQPQTMTQPIVGSSNPMMGILGGAGTGAMLGSMIPGLGTGLGAGAGGLMGLLGGK